METAAPQREAARTGLAATLARVRLWAGWAVTVLLAGYAVYTINASMGVLMNALSVSSLPWLLASAVLLVFSLRLMAWRQLLLLRHAGMPISFALSWQMILAGLFANNIMPAGTGYDLTRLLCLRDQCGQSRAKVLGLVLVDRFLGVMGLSLLAIGSFAIASIPPRTLPAGASRILLAATVVPFALGIGLLFLRHEKSFDTLSRILARLPLGGLIQALLSGMRHFTRRRSILVFALALATLGHLCTVIGIAAIAWPLFGPQAALDSTLATPLVFFAASVPVTPTNLGWTEAVADATWAVLGLRGGLIIFLCWRVVCAAVSLFGITAYTSLLGKKNA